MIRFSTNDFDWDKASRTFSQEVSVLHNLLISDDMPWEFEMVNPKTGNVVLFKHCLTERDMDNDIKLWAYIGSVNGVALAVTIWND